MNAVNGVVGVFNVQGSSWSRKKRQFHIHDPSPPPLEAKVYPKDIHPFDQDNRSAKFYALYSDANDSLTRIRVDEGVSISLASGKSDVVTVAPVFSVAVGFQVACIGLINMLNAGGAVLDVKLGNASSGSAQCEVLVKGFGQLLFFVSAAPTRVTLNDRDLRFEYDERGKRLLVSVSEASELQNVVLLDF